MLQDWQTPEKILQAGRNARPDIARFGQRMLRNQILPRGVLLAHQLFHAPCQLTSLGAGIPVNREGWAIAIGWKFGVWSVPP